LHEDHVLKLKVLITPLACLLCLASGNALSESLKNYTPATHEVPDRPLNDAVTQATDKAASEDSTRATSQHTTDAPARATDAVAINNLALASTQATDTALGEDSAQASIPSINEALAEDLIDAGELLANVGACRGPH